jgi:hypothetical protein
MGELFCIMAKIEWASTISAIASIFTAFVAWKALDIWRKQKKANLSTDLLDALTDEFHELIFALNPPLEFLNFVNISIQSHQELSGEYDGAVKYIENNGAKDSEKLNEYLLPCQQHVAKIRSLSAKGQVLGLKNYSRCTSACDSLCKKYDQLMALRVLLAMRGTNWNNAIAKKSLESVLTINHFQMKEDISIQNMNYLVFVKENYLEIWG